MFFAGTTTDLMPTLLGMYDALFDTNKNISPDHKVQQSQIKSVVPVSVKKSNHFTNLSPTVQKMLANITSDQNENNLDECNKKPHCFRNSKYFESQKSFCAKKNSDSRNSLLFNHLNKSSECLATICDNATSNVQKMLSNIPDQDLVITCTESVKKLNNANDVLSKDAAADKCKYSQSFSYKNQENIKISNLQRGHSDVNSSFLHKISNRCNNNICEIEITNSSDSVNVSTGCINNNSSVNSVNGKQKITSLSPKMAMKRNNYLQVGFL